MSKVTVGLGMGSGYSQLRVTILRGVGAAAGAKARSGLCGRGGGFPRHVPAITMLAHKTANADAAMRDPIARVVVLALQLTKLRKQVGQFLGCRP